MTVYDQEWLQSQFAALSPVVGDFEKSSWARHRRAMRHHVEKSVPEELCRWSTIQAGIYVGETQATADQYNYLIARPRFGQYKIGMTESTFGAPTPTSMASYASGYSIHLTMHLAKWEECTWRKIEYLNTIVEFGGGYGLMCAIARRMGFTGQYVIADFPEMCLLQEYYLGNLGYEVDTRPIDDGGNHESLPQHVDLLIGCYSISEAPFGTRDRFLALANPDSMLITYQPEYEGKDNSTYFRLYSLTHTEYTWQFILNPYFYCGEGHWYLIADKRGL